MLRLIDTFLLFLGWRGSRARGRLVYRVLFDLAVPERQVPSESKTDMR